MLFSPATRESVDERFRPHAPAEWDANGLSRSSCIEPEGDDDCFNPDGEVPERDADTHWLVGNDGLVGSLAVKGLFDSHAFHYNDIDQGKLGSCWLLASIAAVAAQDPDHLASMFTEMVDSHGRRAFGVKLYIHNGKASSEQHCYVVNTRVPQRLGVTNLYAGSGVEIWVAMLEKALAVALGGYEKIDGGYSASAFHYLLGLPVTSFHVRGKMGIQRIADLLAHGRPATISSQNYDGTRTDIAKEHHAYAIIGADPDKQTLRLYNPWGRELTISKEELDAYFHRFCYVK